MKTRLRKIFAWTLDHGALAFAMPVAIWAEIVTGLVVLHAGLSILPPGWPHWTALAVRGYAALCAVAAGAAFLLACEKWLRRAAVMVADGGRA